MPSLAVMVGLSHAVFGFGEGEEERGEGEREKQSARAKRERGPRKGKRESARESARERAREHARERAREEDGPKLVKKNPKKLTGQVRAHPSDAGTLEDAARELEVSAVADLC